VVKSFTAADKGLSAAASLIDYAIQIKAANAACHSAHALWHLKSGFTTFQVI